MATAIPAGGTAGPATPTTGSQRLAAAIAAAFDQREQTQREQAEHEAFEAWRASGQQTPRQPFFARRTPQGANPTAHGRVGWGWAAAAVAAFILIAVVLSPSGDRRPQQPVGGGQQTGGIPSSPMFETGGRMPNVETQAAAAQRGWHVEKGKPGDAGCATVGNALRCPNRWVKN